MNVFKKLGLWYILPRPAPGRTVDLRGQSCRRGFTITGLIWVCGIRRGPVVVAVRLVVGRASRRTCPLVALVRLGWAMPG